MPCSPLHLDKLSHDTCPNSTTPCLCLSVSLQVCVEGPKERLDDTVYSQPALFVASLAAVEKLKKEDPG
jgi:malonyl CoA-acyl carrier protein transacylase